MLSVPVGTGIIIDIFHLYVFICIYIINSVYSILSKPDLYLHHHYRNDFLFRKLIAVPYNREMGDGGYIVNKVCEAKVGRPNSQLNLSNPRRFFNLVSNWSLSNLVSNWELQSPTKMDDIVADLTVLVHFLKIFNLQ